MKVLIALDDSQYGEAALESVLSRPWWGDTQFIVLTVVPIIAAAFNDWAPYAVNEWIALREDEKRRASELVQKAADRMRKQIPGASVEICVEEGNIPDKITEKAQSWPADVIILGSHGRSGLTKFLLGSVAESVLHRAPCSVEIVKIATAAAQQPLDSKSAVAELH